MFEFLVITVFIVAGVITVIKAIAKIVELCSPGEGGG